MQGMGSVACMGASVQSFGREIWGKETLGRPRHGWEDNINIDL